MLEAFNTWFCIGLLLYGLMAGMEVMVAFACGRPVWSWLLVASAVWHAGALGLAAAGIAWLVVSPDLVPPLMARYGTAGALAVGVLWGALVATADQRVWAVVWDSSLWRLPTRVHETWEHGRARPAQPRWTEPHDHTPGMPLPIDTGPAPDVPGVPSLRKGRRRKTVAWQSADDLLVPGRPQEEQDPCS